MSTRPALLFLVHRIPYPPNKGDKIRSYQLLKSLCQDYEVHLGGFIDDPADWQHLPALQALTATSLFDALRPRRAKLRALTGLVRGTPLTLPYFYSARLQRWVAQTLAREPVSRVVVFSSSMAQYLPKHVAAGQTRVIDFVDVDSDKWAQYAKQQHGPMAWLYRREARLLSRYEAALAQDFDASLFVSSTEAALFRSRHPELDPARIHHLNNGVDCHFFTPGEATPPAEPGIVFTGAMDYWANVDAVSWFCRQVWPRLIQRHPTLTLKIVGSNPTRAVQALARLPNVAVTGRVDDVRPYLDAAHVVIAPLQIARGIQNKVLEALAMAKPVVATSMAMEGIDAAADLDIQVADDADAFIAACEHLLNRPQPASAAVNRAWVQQHFSWQHNLAKLHRLLDTPSLSSRQTELSA